MSRRHAARFLGLILAVGFATACGPAPPPSPTPTQASTDDGSTSTGLFFPTYTIDIAPGPYVLDGTLMTTRGCIFIEPDDGLRYLAIWPAGSRVELADRAGIRLVGGEFAEFGMGISAPGREYQNAELSTVQDLVGPIPEVCRGEEPFWFVLPPLEAPD